MLTSIPEGRHLDWANDPRPAPGRHRRRRYGPLAGADRVHHVSVWPEVATKLASLDPGVYGTFVLLGSLARGILAKMKALPLAAALGRRRMRKPSAVLAWVETGAISTPPGS